MNKHDAQRRRVTPAPRIPPGRPNTWGFVRHRDRTVCLRCGHSVRWRSVMAQYDHARTKHGLMPDGQGGWWWPDVPDLFNQGLSGKEPRDA